MNRKLIVELSLAAGLVGGILSHYLIPGSVLAQSKAAAPKEIVSQSFVLVNNEGVTLGTFGVGIDGSASITLFDKSGKVIWSENGKPSGRQLSTSISN